MVDNAIPGKSNVISDWDDSFNKLLIYAYSDKDPVRYICLDLKEKALNEITPTRPWLPSDALCRTQIIHFKTEDGLRLEGYLTLPKTGEQPYSMVTLAHGGPWARDQGGFDTQTQFLANRGYAVLRVNYRGSTGYGATISEKPAFEFKKCMKM